MSTGELVGLLVTVAWLAGVTGAVVMALIASRRTSSLDMRTRRADAHAEWLAAYRTLTRTSASFVAAFRALDSERRDSSYFSLRCEEAQRTRAAWCAAMGELDRAEARLLVLRVSPSTHAQFVPFPRMRPEALRAAIHGDQGDFDRLLHQLHLADERAARFVAAATNSARGRWFPARELFLRLAARAETIVRHWGSGPQRSGARTAKNTKRVDPSDS